MVILAASFLALLPEIAYVTFFYCARAVTSVLKRVCLNLPNSGKLSFKRLSSSGGCGEEKLFK